MVRRAAFAAALAAAALLALCATGADACTREEYLAKFGAEYVLEAGPGVAAPLIRGGAVEATVTYTTACAGGGAAFEARIIEKPDFPPVAILFRHEPACAAPLATARSWTGKVAAPLPVAQSTGEAAPRYVALPPGGAYELMLLREEAAPASGLPYGAEADEPAEPAAVAAGSTQEAGALKAPAAAGNESAADEGPVNLELGAPEAGVAGALAAQQ